MLFFYCLSHFFQHQIYISGCKMRIFLSCCLILYVVTKLHLEGLYKDEGDIKHNELLMLKHLNLPRLSPLSPTRRHRLFLLSLLFCLILILLLSRITRTSRCWDFQSRIKTIPAYLKRIFPTNILHLHHFIPRENVIVGK